MITTFTPTLNSIVDDEEQSQNTMDVLSNEDVEFYEGLKPALNQLIIEPSGDAVNRVLMFSKSL